MLPRSALIITRLLAAVGGGYAVTSGMVALSCVALPAGAILSRGEAVALSSMLAFPIYLVIIIWAFADRKLSRLYILLVVAGTVSWATVFGWAGLVGPT